MLPFEQQVDRLAAQLRAVETVEQNRPAAALGVADFAGEDRGLGRFVAALAGEVAVAEPLDQHVPQGLGRAGEHLVAGRVGRLLISAPSSRPCSSTMPSPQTMTTFFCRS